MQPVDSLLSKTRCGIARQRRSGVKWSTRCAPQRQRYAIICRQAQPEGTEQQSTGASSSHSASNGLPPDSDTSIAGDNQTALVDASQSAELPVAQTQTTSKPAFGIPHRWQIVMLMAAAFVLCNMDKVNMSVAVIPMAAEFGWSNSVRGLVNSSFFWGYAATQVPAGWIATKIGGARVLMFGVFFWSLGTLIAPPLARISITALCLSRILVGLGEGFAPSAATNVMARIVPASERAKAVTLVFGSLDLGSAVGLIVCGPLIRSFGWPFVFYVFAVVGIVWSAVWPLADPERPSTQLASSPARQPQGAGAQGKGAQASEDAVPIPWGAFFKCVPVWALIAAHFCYNWGYYGLLAWLPSYFELALGQPVSQSSILSLIPYLAMTAMSAVVGPMADSLLKVWDASRVRKFCQGVAFAGPALCMCAVALLTPATPAGANDVVLSIGALAVTVKQALVALFSVAFALGAWSRGGLYCNHQDMSPKYAAVLLGITNTAGALPGVIAVWLVGLLLDVSGSWAQALFIPTAICQISGLLLYTVFGSSKRQSFGQSNGQSYAMA